MNHVYQFAADALAIEWGEYVDPQRRIKYVSSRCVIDGELHGLDEPVDSSLPEPYSTERAKERCVDKLIISQYERRKAQQLKEAECLP